RGTRDTSSSDRLQTDAQRVQRSQHETDVRPGFPLLDVDDPFAAHADARCERALVELEPLPAFADQGGEVGCRPNHHRSEDSIVMSPIGYNRGSHRSVTPPRRHRSVTSPEVTNW